MCIVGSVFFFKIDLRNLFSKFDSSVMLPGFVIGKATLTSAFRDGKEIIRLQFNKHDLRK